MLTGRQLERAVVPGIAVLAVIQLATAAWMVLAPHGFFGAIGPFGVYNHHFLEDAAAFTGGLGATLALSLRRPAWRVGALGATAASTGLHAVNHWFDVGHAHAGSHAGVVDAVTLTVTFAFAAALVAGAQRTAGAGAGRGGGESVRVNAR